MHVVSLLLLLLQLYRRAQHAKRASDVNVALGRYSLLKQRLGGGAKTSFFHCQGTDTERELEKELELVA